MDIPARLKTAILLENVHTRDLRKPCKAIGYVTMVIYGFLAVVLHVGGIIFLLSHEWTVRRLFYEAKEMEEAWMLHRSMFGYFLIKGLKEDNLSYILPLIVDTVVDLSACAAYVALQPFTSVYDEMTPRVIASLVCSVLVDLVILILPGNYYRRMTRGNLEAESEQPDV
ncbi:Hypothetical protein NTJ_12403 [Nesidiocoris tenuis]|uniref:Ion transport domain-containing protein n=1 Tax=Nesidiocoris tenuis TaxID=355587 RepID=A0ABN7B8V5_9HEMI|nr:Hypothetical protein NTJ_12403 [Nesidiocoris tenuis]